MQITKLIICGIDICYIAHPHLINIINREFFDKIWILKIDVIRVGRMVRLARRYDEFVPVQQVEKLVSTHIHCITQYGTDKIIEFQTTYNRHFSTINSHLRQYLLFYFQLAKSLAFVFVVSLLRFAKQSAECCQRFGRVLYGQAFYCLTPSFFSRSMPSSCLMISRSRS